MRLNRIFFLALYCFLTLLGPRSTAKKVAFKDCGSVEGQIQSIDVAPCSTDPCVLKIGTNVTGTLAFVSKEVVTSGDVEAWAVMGDFPIPIPPPGGYDLCEGYGVTCPLKSGVAVEFQTTQYMESYFPAGQVTLKGQVTEQNKKVLFCFELPLTLTE